MKSHITLVAMAAKIAVKPAEEHLMYLRPGLMRGNQAENGSSRAATTAYNNCIKLPSGVCIVGTSTAYLLLLAGMRTWWQPPDPRLTPPEKEYYTNQIEKGDNKYMRRDIKKSFWVNSEEDRDIKAKSQAAGLTEAEFLRQRVKGYHPVVMPDEVFWKTMESIREFADRIDEVAMNADNKADVIAITAEAMRWRTFQNGIEQEILIPKRGDH